MTFDDLRTFTAVVFFVGMGAGVLLSAIVANAGWKMAAFASTAEAAARIAEKCAQEAEIRMNERRIADLKGRFGKTCAAIFSAGEEDVIDEQGKAVIE